MQKPFIQYSYEKLEDDERQYDYTDIGQTGVDAKYTRIATDEGNPFIEALPSPRSGDELKLSAAKGIPGFSREEELKKSPHQQMLSISRLRDVRFLLPLNFQLEDECYSSLVLSYRARKMMLDADGDIKLPYEAKNKPQFSTGILVGNDAAAANAGFSLIGYSGCGKSSALETLFKNYPQYIIHHGDGLATYPQIVYLVVQCPPHSNFRGLYKNIGVAIDKALGNVKPVYAKELDAGNHGNLAACTDKVRQCIEKFSIGIIIFDEIQHLNFDTSLENSFESILELTNQTKVAFGVVGTEDAYDKIFSGNLRQARRLGTQIRADNYCNQKKYFAALVKELFAYQWFNEFVEPTDEIISALYDCTKGIINQLIGIYMYMNADYVRAEKKPVINADYVYKTNKKHYSGMMEIIRNMSTSEAEDERVKLLKRADEEFLQLLNEEKEKAAMDAAFSAMEDVDANERIRLKQVVIDRISSVSTEYNDTAIEHAFCAVIKTDEAKKCMGNDTKITQMVFEKLRRKPTGPKKKSEKAETEKKINPQDIRSFLLEDQTPPIISIA